MERNKFKIIYIDFPWKFNSRSNPNTKFGSGMSVYAGMSLDEIKSISSLLNGICDDSCAILAWATGAKMNEFFEWAFHMRDNYGFRYCTKLYSWLKVSKDGTPRALPGFYSLSNTEDVFLLARGKVDVVQKGDKQVVLEELPEEVLREVCLKPHSRKPSFIREKIVKTFGDVPRIEIFSRSEKKFDSDGWVNVGNEVAETPGLDIRNALSMLVADTYIDK